MLCAAHFSVRQDGGRELSGEVGGELIVVSILPHIISIQCIAYIFYDILYKVLIRAAAQEEEKRLT